MSVFNELFDDMGEAYAAIVRAHLKIKAEAGDRRAADLLDDDLDETPEIGDVVFVDGVTAVWDVPYDEAGNPGTAGWWCPSKSDWVQVGEDAAPLVRFGRPVPPRQAVELYRSVEAMFEAMVVAEQQVNPSTGAKFLKRTDIVSVSHLVDWWRGLTEIDDDDE